MVVPCKSFKLSEVRLQDNGMVSVKDFAVDWKFTER